MLHRHTPNQSWFLVSVLRTSLFLSPLIGGCGFKTGVDNTVTPGQDRHFDGSHLQEAKVLFRAFEHEGVVARSTAVASGPGGTATAHGETVGRSEAVPRWILQEAQQALPFGTITNLQSVGSPPDFILEGGLDYKWHTPWWTWVQFVDLGVHAWIAPTLGRHLIMEFQLHLYDVDHQLLSSWTATRKVKYVSQIWWMMSHGGAHGSGFEKEYRTYLRDIFEEIGAEMRKQMSDGPPLLPPDHAPEPQRMETEEEDAGLDAPPP